MSFFTQVVSRSWSLQTGNAGETRPHVTFLKNGNVAGLDEMLRWTLKDGVLDILDVAGSLRHRFNEIAKAADGHVTLVDSCAATQNRMVTLLTHLDPSEAAFECPNLLVRQRTGAGRTKNLVVLRANERSLHPQWLNIACDTRRTWDLCISFYGSRENFGIDEHAEYQVLQEANRKYHAIADLFHSASPLWVYDIVAFPDDDLLTTWSDINRMFEYSRRYDLLLSQPALSNHVTHPITRVDPRYSLRFTSFVEPIAPWFSREALRACLPTFSGTLTGYGLDHVWPKLLGEPRNRMAVIDDIVFEHTRPVAQNYDMEGALAEGWQFQMRFGAYPKEVEYGGIYREPIDRYQKW